MTTRLRPWMGGAALVVAVAVAGCAGRKFAEQSATVVQRTPAGAPAEARVLKIRVADDGQTVAGLDRTSREALARAEAAGKLAEHRFLYTITLQDDGFRLRLNRYAMSDGDQTKLKALADQLKLDNKNVYLEIQGHTDAAGKPDDNLRRGQQRAEAVRLFLNQQGVPLNRMAAVSYGDTAPVASNKTKAGRAQNRRVQIVVLA